MYTFLNSHNQGSIEANRNKCSLIGIYPNSACDTRHNYYPESQYARDKHEILAL